MYVNLNISRTDVASLQGAVYMVVAVATLVGTPTAGALLKTTDEKHFANLIIFSGVLTLAGTVVLAMAGVVGSPRLRRLFRRTEEEAEGVSEEPAPDADSSKA